MALTTKNQSSACRPRKRGVRQRGMPGLAPPLLLLVGRDADRPVALQRVLVIGVPPALADDAERLDQPPAVRDRNMVGREGLRRRRADRARILLVDRVGSSRWMSGRRRPSISSCSTGVGGGSARSLTGGPGCGRRRGRALQPPRRRGSSTRRRAGRARLAARPGGDAAIACAGARHERDEGAPRGSFPVAHILVVRADERRERAADVAQVRRSLRKRHVDPVGADRGSARCRSRRRAGCRHCAGRGRRSCRSGRCRRPTRRSRRPARPPR